MYKQKFGNSAGSKSEYDGILLENQIASNLFNLNNNNFSFKSVGGYYYKSEYFLCFDFPKKVIMI